MHINQLLNQNTDHLGHHDDLGLDHQHVHHPQGWFVLDLTDHHLPTGAFPVLEDAAENPFLGNMQGKSEEEEILKHFGSQLRNDQVSARMVVVPKSLWAEYPKVLHF